jgi:xanthine dehydrogenase YagS FAD-binding subunit
MRQFAHFNASTLEEAVATLRRYGGKACVIAGGTDLIGKMKDEILPRYPEAVVNLKTIPDLDYIKEDKEGLKIGALTRLEDIATHPSVRAGYPALATAAHRTASPHLREMGTIAGNLTQDIRCWYYRHPNNRFPCLRKGGGRCYAIEGDNRYHSIFGGSVVKGCFAVHPSDTAPALIALGGKVKTTKRTIDVEELFQVDVMKTTVLDQDEIVTEILVPAPAENTKSAFLKFAPRKTIDFATVNCAVMIATTGAEVSAARICLNAVSVNPYRATGAEEAIIGRVVDEDTAEEAGTAAVAAAQAMSHNLYKVQIARVLVKRTILERSG